MSTEENLINNKQENGDFRMIRLCYHYNFICLQVCEGQIHFARRTDGKKTSLPVFHGLKGPDIVRSLVEIEATFGKNLQILKNVKHTILDVKVRILIGHPSLRHLTSHRFIYSIFLCSDGSDLRPVAIRNTNQTILA